MNMNTSLNGTEVTHSVRGIALWIRPIKSRPWLLVLIAFVFYAGRMFRLISRYAVNVFFSDQWDFNDATLFQRHSLWQMFNWQHGPHRQGLGALFERMVDPLFGWNSRTESFVIGGVIVAAAICAFWLKRKLYGELSVFDVVIPAILFIPGQWATWFMSANFAHGPFPLLLILLYCLSWTSRRRDVRYLLVLFINFVTIYTGFGIFLGVVTPILLILDYWASAPQTRLSKTYFTCAILVALASLGSFFVGYKLLPGLPCFSLQPRSPTSYLAFVPLMFANFFGIRPQQSAHHRRLNRIHFAVLCEYGLWKTLRRAQDSVGIALRDLSGTRHTRLLLLSAESSSGGGAKVPAEWLFDGDCSGLSLS